MIKVLREVCDGNNTEIRYAIDTDPEEGVYFVGNYKTHVNDRFTSLTAAKQHEQTLLAEWQKEEADRQAAFDAIRTNTIDIPASYL